MVNRLFNKSDLRFELFKIECIFKIKSKQDVYDSLKTLNIHFWHLLSLKYNKSTIKYNTLTQDQLTDTLKEYYDYLKGM